MSAISDLVLSLCIFFSVLQVSLALVHALI